MPLKACPGTKYRPDLFYCSYLPIIRRPSAILIWHRFAQLPKQPLLLPNRCPNLTPHPTNRPAVGQALAASPPSPARLCFPSPPVSTLTSAPCSQPLLTGPPPDVRLEHAWPGLLPPPAHRRVLWRLLGEATLLFCCSLQCCSASCFCCSSCFCCASCSCRASYVPSALALHPEIVYPRRSQLMVRSGARGALPKADWRGLPWPTAIPCRPAPPAA